MGHDEFLYLPPGFRFHPTDEEIVTHYLLEKIADQNFCSFAVAEANFNDCEPWDLPGKANMGEKEWFFFCKKDRKYPSGMRTNRATESGYWKATGKDKEIYKGEGVLVGMKKTLVFYMGRAPSGQKSNWVMHEYRLEGKHKQPHSFSRTPEDEWVVCKVYNKMKDANIRPVPERSATRINSSVDDFVVDKPSLPPLMDSSFFHREAEETKEIQMNELNQSIFCSQPHRLQRPFFLNSEEEIMRTALTSDQALISIRNQMKLGQPPNSIACASQDAGLSTERNAEASSAVSKHQINSLQDYFDGRSIGLQDLDFDSIMKYEFV